MAFKTDFNLCSTIWRIQQQKIKMRMRTKRNNVDLKRDSKELKHWLTIFMCPKGSGSGELRRLSFPNDENKSHSGCFVSLGRISGIYSWNPIALTLKCPYVDSKLLPWWRNKDTVKVNITVILYIRGKIISQKCRTLVSL